jgi:hypothetical protein
MSRPIDWDNPYESVVIEGWCAGYVALSEAAKALGIEPESVIEQARAHGLKLPSKWDLELFRLRDVNYRANHGDDGE